MNVRDERGSQESTFASDGEEGLMDLGEKRRYSCKKEESKNARAGR